MIRIPHSWCSSFWQMSDEMNMTSVIEGRMPQKEDECLIDESVAKETGYQVGDTIQVHADNDEDILDTLVTDTFTITGIGANPLYISFERGSTTVGSGQISGFVDCTRGKFFSGKLYTSHDSSRRGRGIGVPYGRV